MLTNSEDPSVSGFGRDEEEAILTKARLLAIVDSTDDAVISKTLDGVIRSWNRAAERIFGYSEEEAIGQPMLMLIPAGREDEETMILARLRRGERVEHFETVRQHKDGTTANVSLTISPLLGRNGEVIGASQICRDIDERREAEAMQARLGAIIESSDDAIVSKSLDGIIQSWNRGAETLFGYLAEEVIGKPLMILLPPDRVEEETRILERLRRGERVDHFETIRMRKDGRMVDVSVTISPIRDSSGRLIGASKVARDITDRKITEAVMSRLNEELESRVKERTSALEAANREMESFTYSIAHDLRGPMRAIVANSAMLIEDYGNHLPAEGASMLRRQSEAAKRLAALVEDLLGYSRLGKSQPRKEFVDITELAREVAAEIRPERAGYDIQVEDGLSATGDRPLLRLMLQNLLDNACKFSPDGGIVEVGAAQTALFVRDQGVGFSMEYAEKVFAPFERLVRNEQFPGTGIGLANVKRIIEKHGGTIWVDSAPGQGSTFYFRLP